jgi:hypothetical protein
MSRDLTKMRKDFDALKEKYDAFVKQQNSTHLEIDIDLRNLGNDVKSLMPIEPKEKKEEPEKKPEPVRSHPYGNWRP